MDISFVQDTMIDRFRDRPMAELKHYMHQSKSLFPFLESVPENEINHQPTNKVYQAYLQHCKENQVVPLGQIDFSRKLSSFGLKITDKKMCGKKRRIFNLNTEW